MKHLELVAGDAVPDDLPPLVLKSFNKSYIQEVVTEDPAAFDHIGKAADYMQAQGVCAFSGIRPLQRGEDGPAKPFMVMQDLGEHELFVDHYDKNYALFKIKTVEQEVDFLTAFCRLLAVLDFVHDTAKRPVIDIKLENIMAIKGSGGRLRNFVLVDCDAWCEKGVMATPMYIPNELAGAIVKAQIKQDATMVPFYYDFRALAKVLAILVSQHESRSRVTYTLGRSVLGGVVIDVVDCGEDFPCDRLCHELLTAKAGQAAERIIEAARIDPRYLGVYRSYRNRCERLYRESAGIVASEVVRAGGAAGGAGDAPCVAADVSPRIGVQKRPKKIKYKTVNVCMGLKMWRVRAPVAAVDKVAVVPTSDGCYVPPAEYK